jgi:hypothetical protein
MRRLESGAGCGACGRGSRDLRTRAAPGLRPPGHYEPAARSSLTEADKASAKRGPRPSWRLTGDAGDAAVERRAALRQTIEIAIELASFHTAFHTFFRRFVLPACAHHCPDST